MEPLTLLEVVDIMVRILDAPVALLTVTAVKVLMVEITEEVDETTKAQISLTDVTALSESALLQTLDEHNRSPPSRSGLSQRQSIPRLSTKQDREFFDQEKASCKHEICKNTVSSLSLNLDC